VRVSGAPTRACARAVGKAVVNSPLFKCAVAGNDPNVGRLVAAIGKCVGGHADTLLPGGGRVDVSGMSLSLGGLRIFDRGTFHLPPETEAKLVGHMKSAQLWGEPLLSMPTRCVLSLHLVQYFSVLCPFVCFAESAPVVSNTNSGSSVDGGRLLVGAQDVAYKTPVNFPAHERCVEVSINCFFRSFTTRSLVHFANPQIEVNLHAGSHDITVLGADLTHEYVAENADYRS
jgi:glutamate N-acetyltransferase / amino-acid N-acetyltransferase